MTRNGSSFNAVIQFEKLPKTYAYAYNCVYT